jgi:WhiB family transcriptional regulator, redox-sensing transcriptional regulator
MNLYWREEAACAETDPALFFTPPADEHEKAKEKVARIRAAKAICAGCPVIRDCLAWAIETDDREAILGGTTPAERKSMRRPENRFTRAEQTRANIISLARQGVAAEDIAIRLGFSTGGIQRHIRSARESGELGPGTSSRKPPTADKRCGSNAGRVAHERRNEDSCADCKRAVAEYQRRLAEAKR